MQCCDPAVVLFSMEFADPVIQDPPVPIDGSPLAAHFDVVTATDMSYPIRLTAAQVVAAGTLAAALGNLAALDQCLNARLEFALGIIHTND